MSGIKWRKRPKTVLITGTSEFLKEREIRRAIEALPSHRVLEFEAGSHIDEIQSALRSVSLFDSEKLVVIRSIGDAKSRRKILLDYCEDPRDDIVLVMMSKHRKRLHKWLSSDLKTQCKENLDEPSKWKLPEWLMGEARSRGLDFPEDYAEAIVLNVGEDLYSLANELDKIKIYCGDRETVEVSDVEASLFQHTAVSPFEVVDLWAQGDVISASRLYLVHLDKTPKTEWMKSILVILGGLQDRVEALLKSKDLKARGKSSSEIAKAIGVSPYIYMNSLLSQVSVRNVYQLEKSYILLCDIESRTKRGAPGKLLLENFLITE